MSDGDIPRSVRPPSHRAGSDRVESRWSSPGCERIPVLGGLTNCRSSTDRAERIGRLRLNHLVTLSEELCTKCEYKVWSDPPIASPEVCSKGPMSESRDSVRAEVGW